MIVTILSGGLGNQMFQYAAARALSLRNNQKIVFNTRLGFKRDIQFRRNYGLDAFNVKYNHNKILSFDFFGGDFLEKISRMFGRHVLCPWYRYFADDSQNAYSIVTTPHKYKNVILMGYWVNQRYFIDQVSTIVNDFSLNLSIPQVVKNYINGIESFDGVTIAVGIRIYQEIKDERVRNNGFFYVQADFYQKAFEYCVQKYGKVKFLIFTQAKDWAKSNLNLTNYNYDFVETFPDEDKAVFDMYIMSKCQHYIISNSTFYFWGAWLNRNTNKEVIVPKQWTNSTLEEWTRL